MACSKPEAAGRGSINKLSPISASLSTGLAAASLIGCGGGVSALTLIAGSRVGSLLLIDLFLLNNSNFITIIVSWADARDVSMLIAVVTGYVLLVFRAISTAMTRFLADATKFWHRAPSWC